MKKFLLISLIAIANVTFSNAQKFDRNDFCTVSPKLSGYLELSGSMSGQHEMLLFEPAEGMKLSPVTGGAALDGVIGCRLNKFIFVGGGTGVRFTINTMDNKSLDVHGRVTNLHVPLFADARFFFPISAKSLFPYIEVSVGPSLWIYQRISASQNKGGFDEVERTIGDEKDNPLNIPTKHAFFAFFRVNTGIEVGRFTCGVGYELRGNNDYTTNYGFLKIGIRLGKI